MDNTDAAKVADSAAVRAAFADNVVRKVADDMLAAVDTDAGCEYCLCQTDLEGYLT